MLFPPVADFSAPLLIWYKKNARILPWRDDRAPYRVWISEIMLQQTRVEAVKPYFERFLSVLPDIAALSNVADEQLMKLWEGLGYYSRARNLKKAAQMLMQDFGGSLPASFELLQTLPGVGPYTAGAIASIAFGIPVPAVDGNVLRVLSRIAASPENVSDAKVKKTVDATLRQIIPPAHAGDFNQALMELGATVCLPNGMPKCDICPVQKLCEGYARGIAHTLPLKDAKKERRIEQRTVFVILNDHKAALLKRPPRGLLAGLFELPNAEGVLDEAVALAWLSSHGIDACPLTQLGASKHIFTHVEWHMTGYLVHAASQPEIFLWRTLSQVENDCALPSAFRFYTKILRQELGTVV
ncbi:MAG: A/G-specific adenine glycosylase [Christensenella sp.]|uniref:A/G-specific adenine glycosylase n=1 Tax=Christensenella sp. TaxID=1935934 RepID=UPI002B202DAA|nr:A/G-specific adenine glycosylase [Christensenella sp.]MEA5004454.1 A/G-specific adenine glycosylase [Christensenella sp.]